MDLQLKYNLSEIKLFFKNMGTKEPAGSQPRCFEVLGSLGPGRVALVGLRVALLFRAWGRVCAVAVVAFCSE